MQGKNFISAVHFCKAHTSPNRNDFVAFGGCKSFFPCTPLQNFLSLIIKHQKNYLQLFPETL